MKSKVVVITGASSGIGEACAKLLAEKGHKIVMCARREERLKEIASSIREKGGEAIHLKADVTDILQMEEVAQAALTEFGRIDVWVNNAGLMPVSEIIKDKVDEWDRMVDVNIKGVLYGTHACLKIMREQKEGHIINMGSVAGHVSNPGSAVYSATKFAVRALSDALRKEEAQAKSGVRITLIAPGAIDTELLSTITDPDALQSTGSFYASTAIPALDVAKCVDFAIDMPPEACVDEVILRSTLQVH